MSDFAIIQTALVNASSSCRYHGTDWDRLGRERNGEPRCDSCKQPWRVAQALDALDRQVRLSMIRGAR